MSQSIRNTMLVFLVVFTLLLGACTTAAPAATEPAAQPTPEATAIERTGPKEIILATTTSTRDSGLLDVLIPVFGADSYTVKMIAVGTGQA